MDRKVIIVAPTVVSNSLADNYKHWDTQTPVENIDQLWHGLETGTLSPESDVVILIDILFQPDPEKFIATVASFAPEALVLILSYTNDEEIIKARVAEHVRSTGAKSAPFYFIRRDVAITEIDEAVAYYDHGAAAVDAAIAEQRAVEINVSDRDRNRSGRDTNKNGLVITCTSPKGGSGKTTVGLLLATTIAQASKKAVQKGLTDKELSVCIIDIDVFDGQIGFVLGQRTPTALNIAVSESIIDADLVYNNLVYNERMGVHALLAPVRGLTAKITTPKFYRNVVRILKTMFDVIIIDTSVQHYDDHIKMVALPEADAILLVTTLDVKSVMGLGRWMQVATAPRDQGGHGADKHKMGVVVNQSIPNVGMGEKELAAAALGVPLLVAIPLDTLAVQSAGNANRLEDLVMHPTIGPAYYNLARKIGKTRNFVLAPIIDEGGTSAGKAAPGPGPQPTEQKKPSFFNRNRK